MKVYVGSLGVDYEGSSAILVAKSDLEARAGLEDYAIDQFAYGVEEDHSFQWDADSHCELLGNYSLFVEEFDLIEPLTVTNYPLTEKEIESLTL